MNVRVATSLVLLLFLCGLLATQAQKDNRRRSSRRRPSTESPAVEEVDSKVEEPPVVAAPPEEPKRDVPKDVEEAPKERSTTSKPQFFSPRRGSRRTRPPPVRGESRPKPTLPCFRCNLSSRSRQRPASGATEEGATEQQQHADPSPAPPGGRKVFGQNRRDKGNARGSTRNSSV